MLLLTWMSAQLLREYLSLVMEKIRSSRNTRGNFGEKFNLRKFKSLDDYAIMVTYANHFLQVLGEGSSRRAWVLNSKYALKIAINPKGLAQNRAEMDVFTNPKSQSIVAKVYSADPKFSWLISDLVKPLEAVDEFEELTSVKWYPFIDLLDNGAITNKRDLKNLPPFTKAVIETARANDLMKGDITDLGHWGKTPDGRCVLLDYGFTREVYASHYSSKRAAPKSSDRTVRARKPGNQKLAKSDIEERARQDELTPEALELVELIFARDNVLIMSDGRIKLGLAWGRIRDTFIDAMDLNFSEVDRARLRNAEIAFDRFFSK